MISLRVRTRRVERLQTFMETTQRPNRGDEFSIAFFALGSLVERLFPAWGVPKPKPGFALEEDIILRFLRDASERGAPQASVPAQEENEGGLGSMELFSIVDGEPVDAELREELLNNEEANELATCWRRARISKAASVRVRKRARTAAQRSSRN